MDKIHMIDYRTPLQLGTILECDNGKRYRLGKVIGMGGTGIVYEAEATEIYHMKFALKECYPAMVDDSGKPLYYRDENAIVRCSVDDREREDALSYLRQHLCDEMKNGQKVYSISRIHAVPLREKLNICKINGRALDVAMPQGSWFLMDKVGDISLAELLKMSGDSRGIKSQGVHKKLLSVHEIAGITSQVLSALDDIHRAKMIHGDISAYNIFLASNGVKEKADESVACFIDFGSAIELQQDEFGQWKTPPIRDIWVTPGYVPPEILHRKMGKPICLTVQADIYQVGRLLFFLCTGNALQLGGYQWPYEVGTYETTDYCSEPTRLLLDKILNTALAEDPKQRYKSAKEMLMDLKRLYRITDTISENFLLPANLTGAKDFIGREHLLQDLTAMIMDSSNSYEPIFITGFAGMGKSEFAVQFGLKLNRERPDTVFRIHYHESIQKTIAGLNIVGTELVSKISAKNAISRANSKAREKGAFKSKLRTLKEHYAGKVIIIDDFYVEGKTLNDLRMETGYGELLRELANPEAAVQIIFTTRYQNFDKYEKVVSVTNLSDDELVYIIDSQLRDKESSYPHAYEGQDLLDLIETLGRHTLSVKVAACSMKEGNYSPSEMLDYLRNPKQDDSMPCVTVGVSDQYEELTFYGHLKKLFQLQALSYEEQRVLYCACTIPWWGISQHVFYQCESAKGKRALERLIKLGWLTVGIRVYDSSVKETLLTIHPLVLELCKNELSGFTKDELKKLAKELTKQLSGSDDMEKFHVVIWLSDLNDTLHRWQLDCILACTPRTWKIVINNPNAIIENKTLAIHHIIIGLSTWYWEIIGFFVWSLLGVVGIILVGINSGIFRIPLNNLSTEEMMTIIDSETTVIDMSVLYDIVDNYDIDETLIDTVLRFNVTCQSPELIVPEISHSLLTMLKIMILVTIISGPLLTFDMDFWGALSVVGIPFGLLTAYQIVQLSAYRCVLLSMIVNILCILAIVKKKKCKITSAKFITIISGSVTLLCSYTIIPALDNFIIVRFFINCGRLLLKNIFWNVSLEEERFLIVNMMESLTKISPVFRTNFIVFSLFLTLIYLPIIGKLLCKISKSYRNIAFLLGLSIIIVATCCSINILILLAFIIYLGMFITIDNYCNIHNAMPENNKIIKGARVIYYWFYIGISSLSSILLLPIILFFFHAMNHFIWAATW